MRVHDALAGALIGIVGILILLDASTFPSMPGQSVGPAFFPRVIGGGLLGCATVLMLGGLRRQKTPWIELDRWVRRPRMVLNFGLVFADLLFYALAVARLGFFLTALLFLGVLMFAFGVPRARILPLAMVVTLAIHYAFYSLLRVPLPWGVLEGMAW